MNQKLMQLGCIIIVAINSSVFGFISSWPSYAISVLQNDQSPLGYKISQNESNLIGSIPMLGALIATFFVEMIVEAIGRKKSHILCGLIFMLSWSIIITAKSAIQVIIGRFIAGTSIGIYLALFMVTVSETTELSIRGRAVSVAYLEFNIGVMTSYLLGWFCSYYVICYICITMTVVHVILVSFLKETPVYLLKIGKEKEALDALKFYRGKSKVTNAILEELSYLKNQLNPDATYGTETNELTQLKKENNETQNLNSSSSKSPWVLLFTVPHNRRALINSVSFIFLSVSTGMISVMTYSNQFFAKAAPFMSPDMCSVLLSTVMILTSITTVAVTDLVPRRTLMISSSAASTVCLATIGTTLRWSWAPVWLAPLLTMIFCFTVHMGGLNIVFVQLSESFGPQVNSAASGAMICSMFLANFLVVYTFLPLVKYFGIDITFFLYAIVGLFMTVLSILILKETRRVPLEEIQAMHAKGFLYQRPKK